MSEYTKIFIRLGLLLSTKPFTANPGETAHLLEDWKDPVRTKPPVTTSASYVVFSLYK